MPRYNFSWDNFDDETVENFAEDFGWVEECGATARDWLRVNRKGLQTTHLDSRKVFWTIRDIWVPELGESTLANIVKDLKSFRLGPMNNPRSKSGYIEYINGVRTNSINVKKVFLKYLRVHGHTDTRTTSNGDSKLSEGVNWIENPWTVIPKQQEDDMRSPHDYQKEAWDKLNTAYAAYEAGASMKGLLVMPTGSGKTFTAVRWLAENVINRGGKILWLAHRSELLEQATREFQRLSCYARSRDEVIGRLAGGGHLAASTIGSDEDVIVSSIALLARNPKIRDDVLSYPNLHVVIDEAHHAPAKSYRDLIAQYEKSSGRFLVGLTATPTRTVEAEKPELSKLFDGNILHQVELKLLIERGVLSRPIPVRVKTGTYVEEGLTNADRKHMAKFKNLSEAWLNRIAHMESRNTVILKHFLQNKGRYGKTLIFAINIDHAVALKKDFEDAGIAAEYVASRRPDGTDGDPAEIFQSFRSGEIDVLINVQMVTEGVDIPDVQTVFLVRPTSSEILIRQMIGRALRGKQAGGTETAFLVSFDDHWERYRDWLSPLDLVAELTDPDDEEEVDEDGELHEPQTRFRLKLEMLPHDMIQAVLAHLRETRPERKVDVFEAVPVGQYLAEWEDDDGEYERSIINVHEHQVAYWEELIGKLQQMDPYKWEECLGTEEFDDIFADCDAPAPAFADIDSMVQHFMSNGGEPDFVETEEREKYDPRKLAVRVHEEDLGPRKVQELVESLYDGYAKAVYPTQTDYHTAINDAVMDIQLGPRTPATVNFVPEPDQQLKEDRPHDLTELLRQVLDAGKLILDVPQLSMPQEPEWSRRPVKSWWGHARWRNDQPTGHGRLRVNSLLNSSDVDEETLKFLLWHEYLHLHLKQGHTKEFRRLEKEWPSWRESDRNIDRLIERFEIKYW